MVRYTPKVYRDSRDKDTDRNVEILDIPHDGSLTVSCDAHQDSYTLFSYEQSPTTLFGAKISGSIQQLKCESHDVTHPYGFKLLKFSQKIVWYGDPNFLKLKKPTVKARLLQTYLPSSIDRGERKDLAKKIIKYYEIINSQASSFEIKQKSIKKFKKIMDKIVQYTNYTIVEHASIDNDTYFIVECPVKYYERINEYFSLAKKHTQKKILLIQGGPITDRYLASFESAAKTNGYEKIYNHYNKTLICIHNDITAPSQIFSIPHSHTYFFCTAILYNGYLFISCDIPSPLWLPYFQSHTINRLLTILKLNKGKVILAGNLNLPIAYSEQILQILKDKNVKFTNISGSTHSILMEYPDYMAHYPITTGPSKHSDFGSSIGTTPPSPNHSNDSSSASLPTISPTTTSCTKLIIMPPITPPFPEPQPYGKNKFNIYKMGKNLFIISLIVVAGCAAVYIFAPTILSMPLIISCVNNINNILISSTTKDTIRLLMPFIAGYTLTSGFYSLRHCYNNYNNKPDNTKEAETENSQVKETIYKSVPRSW